jgi:hypothetical protein
MPSEYITTLVYAKPSYMFQAASVNTGVRFSPTNAYDVDPTLGSTALPGFTELAGLYKFYRVASSRVKVAFYNKEAFPEVLYLLPTNTDFGANPSTAVQTSFLSNPNCKSQIIGPLTGGGKAILTHSISTAGYSGASVERAIDPYVGRTNGSASPTNNYYWNIGCLGDANMVTGVDYVIQIWVTIRFFELVEPSV